MVCLKKIFFIIAVLMFSVAVFAQSNFTDVPTFQQGNKAVEQQALWISLIKEKCSPCLEGNKAQFDLSINNVGNLEFAVRAVSLVDSEGVVFASNTLDSIIPLNSTKNFTIDSVIPPPSRGKTVYYKACFSLSSGGQTTQSCENSMRAFVVQNNIEISLVIIYLLLSVMLIVITILLLLVLRKLDKHVVQSVKSR